MTKRNISILIIFVLTISVASLLFFSKDSLLNLFNYKKTSIEDVSFDGEKFVIKGKYLSKIEMWAVPALEDVDLNDHLRLNSANLISDAGKNEIWTAVMGEEPLFIERIYFKGFFEGDVVSRIDFPVAGFENLNKLLWSR
jgi:hypothetical protein